MNVSALKPKKEKDGNTLFTLELTIENPSSVSGDTLSQRGRALRSEGLSGRRLAAYRSFVEKEMNAIKKNTEQSGIFMKAQNGKPSNLNEKQWHTVRTKAFKAWFGDWENDPANASKVVDELKKLTGQKFTNKAKQMSATVSVESAKKIARAEQETVANLKRLWYTEEEAGVLHRAAAMKIGELYERAEHYIEEEVYHKTDDRKAAWHFFEPVTVELKGREETFLTNISVIDYTRGGERIFSLELTIENPISNAEDMAAPASGRQALHTNGCSDIRVAAFQSFVKKEKTKIERNAREKGLIPWRVDEARLNELRGEAAKVQPSLPENIDLRDAKHTLATEDVWHMYRGHCLDSFLYDNQISITFDDIRMIPDIVENYDSVNFINSRKGYTLSFTKTYGDVVYQVTETIGGKEDNPRGTRLKTIFLTEITRNASGRALHPTSFSKNFTRTESVNPITNYIKQNYASEAKKLRRKCEVLSEVLLLRMASRVS